MAEKSPPPKNNLPPPGICPEAAVIAPYQALADLAAQEADRLPWPIHVKVGDLSAGFREAEALLDQGVKIFISRGGTAGLIRKLGQPVVEIGVSACDILEGLKLLTRSRPGFRGPVGFIGFGNILAAAHEVPPVFGPN